MPMVLKGECWGKDGGVGTWKWPKFSVTYGQGCESTDKSANRERESITRIGSDASFFWVSLSNLVIDDNFRI
jgi:hypothetical protein